MPEARKKPCTICRRWFRPNPRVGERQRACSAPECQTARRQKSQANWRARNPEYAITWRLDQRAAQTQPPPEPLRLPAPLNQLPWNVAKDQFGAQGADFIGVMGALLLRSAKDQFRSYGIDPTRVPAILPAPAAKDPFPLRRSREMTLLCSPKVTQHHQPAGAAFAAREGRTRPCASISATSA